MTRRSLLGKLVPRPAPDPDPDRPPATDPTRVNAFILAINTYTSTLAAGVLDLRLWRRVLDAWRRIS